MNSVNGKRSPTGPRGAHFGRGARLAVALALTIFAGLAVGTAPAQAGVVGPNTYRFQNGGSNLCLADSFAGGLQVLACTSQTTQHWRDNTPTASTYQLKNAHTGRCLADSFAGNLQVLACNNQNTQRWEDVNSTASVWRFRNVHTQRCLSDSLGGGLHMASCGSTGYQNWR